ncbi:MAG TPA: sigma-70 family RNA polymerase sigma factor [Candidatus Onthocola stercoravium]|nr:sigma-70 family RNA polymerase sigma factor [Candidatus Onthocola stercoravium]
MAKVIKYINSEVWDNLINNIDSCNVIDELTIILNRLSNMGIKFNLKSIIELLERYPELDNVLYELFKDKSIVTYLDILELSSDEVMINFLILYAIKNEIYEDAFLVSEYSDLINHDFKRVRNYSYYLTDVKKIPLLSKKHTTLCFKKLQEIRDVLSNCSDEEKIKELKELYNHYRNILLNANLRLVIRIANLYSDLQVDMEDLIQTGNMGLIEAVEKYDYTRDSSFSTVANMYIKSAIRRKWFGFEKVIRIPESTYTEINRVKTAEESLTIKLGAKPSIENLAEEVGLSIKVVRRLLKLSDMEIIPYDDLEEDEFTLEDDMLKDYTLREYLDDLINSELNDREKQVIRLHYEHKYKLNQIAGIFNITKSRAGQIDMAAIKKMRARLYSDLSDSKKYTLKDLKKYAYIFQSRKLEVLHIIDCLPLNEQKYMYYVMGDIDALDESMYSSAGIICEKVMSLFNKFLYKLPSNNTGISLNVILGINKNELSDIAVEFYGDSSMQELFTCFGPLLDKYVDESEVYTASLNLLYNRIRESLQGNLEQVLLRNKKKNK